ncbi:hypothetical protein TELCIR_06405 [Teladorsagia circumcincta]|uniref:NR LBD domain-containing protein n=1 Tax=Teladorsagia circumcincta TaxID=45464 RepID=A0A2G9UN15_TELCI|nr:hypothetical protein TELCIR_06405 [Teladorsagia circumcincta]
MFSYTNLAIDDCHQISEDLVKRELIKGNRERRHLEQLLAIIKGPPLDENRQKELMFEVDLITNSYCRNIDQPMSQSMRSIGGNEPDSQLTEILRLIVRRSTDFAQVVGLPVECQTQLLNATLLQVHLLRFASFFDEAEDSFRPAANTSLTHGDLLETLAVDVVDHDEMVRRSSVGCAQCDVHLRSKQRVRSFAGMFCSLQPIPGWMVFVCTWQKSCRMPTLGWTRCYTRWSTKPAMANKMGLSRQILVEAMDPYDGKRPQ